MGEDMPERKLDIEHLLSMTGHDPELADEILDIFRQQSDTWGRMLDPNLPASQWADAAHTIKGTALSIGANELAEACLAAESLGRSGLASPVEAAVVLGDVRSEMTYALEAAARASHALSKPGLRASKDSNS
jgi:HPt (histidine-containing phosphotransfer) domain-containing protein